MRVSKIDLLNVFDAYRDAVGLSDARVSTLVFKRGERINQLRKGSDMAMGNAADAIRWFSNHWPEQALWPEGIERPEPSTVPPSGAAA